MAMTVASKWRTLGKTLWFAVPPLIFVKDRWMWVYWCEGRSMSPTLNPQDTFLDRCFRDVVLVFRNAEFRKGDVVVLHDPTSDKQIVKRLTAMGNEFVAVGGGSYKYVPNGHCWVLGDNPEMSSDSRNFDAVSCGLLNSLVVAVVWPFWRARWLDLVDLDDDPELQPDLSSCVGETGDTEAQRIASAVLAARPSAPADQSEAAPAASPVPESPWEEPAILPGDVCEWLVGGECGLAPPAGVE